MRTPTTAAGRRLAENTARVDFAETNYGLDDIVAIEMEARSDLVRLIRACAVDIFDWSEGRFSSKVDALFKAAGLDSLDDPAISAEWASVDEPRAEERRPARGGPVTDHG